MIGQQDVTSTGKDVWLVNDGIPAFGHTKASGVAVYFYVKSGKMWWACQNCGPCYGNTKECPHIEAVKERKEKRDQCS